MNIMKKLLKLDEVNFTTNLKKSDIIRIAENYVEGKTEEYEINKTNIIYDANSYVVNEPVWYINVISLKTKKLWPEAYDCLTISDKYGKVVYVMNDHGIVVEKY